MISSPIIRAYEKSDKELVLDLFRRNTPKYFAIDEESDFIDYLENERELYYVLLHKSRVVGCGGINFNFNQALARISWDIIHPEYQNKNFGTQLLNYRIDKINSFSHIEKIMVRTSQFAFPFYEKNGFRLIEIHKNYWAKGIDMYKMIYI